jgi:hypothetical protein
MRSSFDALRRDLEPRADKRTQAIAAISPPLYRGRMVIAASTLEIVVFVVIVVVLGVLAGGAFTNAGRAAERVTPLGSSVPQPPEMRKPPEEGGLH